MNDKFRSLAKVAISEANHTGMAAKNRPLLEVARVFIDNHKQTAILGNELWYAIGKRSARTF